MTEATELESKTARILETRPLTRNDPDYLEVSKLVRLLNLPGRVVVAILDDLGIEHWEHNGKTWTSRQALGDFLIRLATER